MKIGIYLVGENNPIIINNWDEFFNYFPDLLVATEQIESFWDEDNNKEYNSCKVISNLMKIQYHKERLQNLINTEIKHN